MKKIVFILLTISLLSSCGIKKELAALKIEQNKLKTEYSSLNEQYNTEKEKNSDLQSIKIALKESDKNITILNEDILNLKNENSKLIKKYPIIKFLKPHYNFGKIKMRSKNKHKFKFINEGNSPLVITGVDVDCSCTVPKYPDYAIMPGEEGIIILEYIPSIPTGVQRKTIGILCNTLKGRANITTIADILDANKKRK